MPVRHFNGSPNLQAHACWVDPANSAYLHPALAESSEMHAPLKGVLTDACHLPQVGQQHSPPHINSAASAFRSNKTKRA